MTNSNGSRPRLALLDALRGVAALMVCVFHTTSGTNLTKFYAPHVAPLFALGYMGVNVFFVISGFVIPYSLWGKGYRLAGFGRYFWQRAARICPPAYVVIVLVIIQTLLADAVHQNHASLARITGAKLLANILFIVPFTDQRWFSGVFWTLAIEFQFYIVLGLLYGVLLARPALLRLLAVGMGLNALMYIPGMSVETYLRFNGIFMLGVAVLCYRQGAFTGRQLAIALGAFGAVAAYQISALDAGFGLATAVAIAVGRGGGGRVLAWLGRISYSLYLTHMLSESTTEYVLSRYWQPRTEVGHTLALALCVGVALLFAEGFYRWVEAPTHRWVRQLGQARPAPMATSQRT